MTNNPGTQDPQQEPYRVSGPADILAFIPHSLGFAPRESLVLMTMNTARLGATLRLDLPAAAFDYRGYAATVSEILCTDASADGVLMALYTERAWKRPDAPPYRRLITQLGECLEDAGLPIRDGWLVSASAWREYFCTDNSCCPWPGHPIRQISDSSLSAEMVFRGSAYARTLDEAVSQDQPPAWECGEETARHADSFARQLGGRWCRYPQFAGTLAVWDRFLASASAAAAAGAGLDDPAGDIPSGARPGPADGGPADGDPTDGDPGGPVPERGCPQLRSDPEAAGFLLASLRVRPVRDTLLVMAALGCAQALDGAAACRLLTADAARPVLPTGHRAGAAAVAGDGSRSGRRSPAPPRRDAAADFRAVLVGQYDLAPDWRGMDAAASVFAELLAAASAAQQVAGAEQMDGEASAALLSLLAWIEWARGRGSRAQLYLTRCLETHPGYRLAQLLEELLASGMFPAWARDPKTAWKGAAERRPGAART